MTKYKTLLSKSQEESDKEELGFKVEEGEQQLAADILNTRRSLSKAKREVLAVKGRFPLDSQSILDAEDDVTAIEQTIERLEGLKKELF